MSNPLDLIAQHDPQLFEAIGESRQLAFSPGALSAKDKLLIGLALDVAKGSEPGVRSLALQALAQGATQQEIMEAVRVVHFINGAGCVYTAARGLAGVFDDQRTG